METTQRRSLTTACLLLLLGACRGVDGDLPSKYRRVVVPENVLESDESRRRGQASFLEHCALCHGETANGRGVRRNLSSRPTAFTDPFWRNRTSPRRAFFVIREGVQGTAMAGWKSLDERESWDLVAYVMSVAEPPT